MSLISFSNAILKDDLSALGFQRKAGSEWIKIVDRMILLSVGTRSLNGFIEISYEISPLFWKLAYNTSIFTVYKGILGKANKEVDLSDVMIPILDEKTDKGKLMVEKGRKLFKLIEPTFGEVKDLESAFYAMHKLDYIASAPFFSRYFGREYSLDEHTIWPPEGAALILCKLGRYDEAYEYLNQALINYSARSYNPYSSSDDLKKLYLNEENRLIPLIESFRQGEVDKIEKLMNEHYFENIKRIEAKYKISIII